MNGLIAAAFGALSMLMSEPTVKKQCKEGMYVCPLNHDITLHYKQSSLCQKGPACYRRLMVHTLAQLESLKKTVKIVQQILKTGKHNMQEAVLTHPQNIL